MISIAGQVICAVAAALLSAWGVQRLLTLCAALAARPAEIARSLATTTTPFVTVQVPLYNEPAVAARAVAAACAIRWPQLEVQILDDSNDETSGIVAAAVARARAAGVDAVQIRRASRDGFKAGALQNGLTQAKGELVAIFDADFVPPVDYLERVVPPMIASGVDMAQARWGHLNRDESWLTRAQAALLDAHFAVEQQGRHARARFFGFNGTAGVWRKSAIERAGGWDATTLTEDLDLSLRAWFAGSRFLYLDDVVVPAELPARLSALRIQQHRWGKGAMQTARARVPALWRTRRPFGEKLDVALKLTQNVCFVLLWLAVAAVPLAALERAGEASRFPVVELAALALGSVPAFAAVLWSVRRGGRGVVASVVDSVLALGLAAALSSHASFAAIAGTLNVGSRTFERTPKDGGRAGPAARAPARRLPAIVLLEAALAALHIGVAVALFHSSLLWRTPFLLLCGASLAALVWTSVKEAVSRPATARVSAA